VTGVVLPVVWAVAAPLAGAILHQRLCLWWLRRLFPASCARRYLRASLSRPVVGGAQVLVAALLLPARLGA